MQCTIKDERSSALAAQINAVDEASAENVSPPQYQIWFKNPATFTLAYGCRVFCFPRFDDLSLRGLPCRPWQSHSIGRQRLLRFARNDIHQSIYDRALEVGALNLLTASWIKDRLLNEISLSVRAVTVCLLKKLAAAPLSPSLLTLLEEK